MVGQAPRRRWSSDSRRVASLYLDAKAYIIERGFAREVDWQADASRLSLNENTFLMEAAWVVLSSGLSERVVRSRFLDIVVALRGLRCAADVWSHRRVCRADALLAFRSARKIDAILTICGYVAHYGFARCYSQLEADGVDFLIRFPLLGPATSRHLAKNLGFAMAKPDRHLTRIATTLGYESAATLCADVSDIVGDSVAVVDIVFWRYATLVPDYPGVLMAAVAASESHPT